MPVDFLLAMLAVSSEAVAMLVLQQSPWQFFAIHSLSSAAMAWFGWRRIRHYYHQPQYWSVLLLFSWCFFLPVLGLSGLFLAMLWVYWSPNRQSAELFVKLEEPVYRNAGQNRDLALGAGSIREQLTNPALSLEARMKALLALQDMPTHHTATLLRAALSDSADDLRLLAYGLLEAKENELMLRIQQALQRYKSQDEHYGAARELAELYWEMVYQNLVLGDMCRFALNQVAFFAKEALKLNATDSGMWIIVGRMHLLNGNYLEAGQAFARVLQLGLLTVRIEPYLAELAFLQKDYTRVRQLMIHTVDEGRMPHARQIALYWSTV